MKIINYILLFVVGICFGAIIFTRCENIGLRKKIADKDGESASLRQQLAACQNAPEEIVVVRDTIVIMSNAKPVKPKPVNAGPVSDPRQTEVEEEPCGTNFYSDRFNLNDSVYADWCAETRGSIESFNILSIGYPQRTTIIKRIVPIVSHDPLAPMVSSLEEKNTLWLYARAQAGINMKNLENTTAGIVWLNKHKWGLGAGAGWSFARNSPTVEAVLLLNIK